MIAPKKLDRAVAFGEPVAFSMSEEVTSRTVLSWPRAYQSCKSTGRDFVLALREYINNTIESLKATSELREATVWFKFGIKEVGGLVDWEHSELIVRDNAGGMSGARLREALQLNCAQLSENADGSDSSLNRHGCGMKSSTVQLARHMSSVQHVASRQIGAATGHGFSYVEPNADVVSDRAQVYEDSSIFPDGTHGTEIYLKGLSNLWPPKQMGSRLYVQKKDGRRETHDQSLVGILAQRLGFYYQWWLSGKKLVTSPQPTDVNVSRGWSRSNYSVVDSNKKLNIVIEVYRLVEDPQNGTTWVPKTDADGAPAVFNIEPLPIAFLDDEDFPTRAVRITETCGADTRAGTVLLGWAKAGNAYTVDDGPIPGKSDLRHPIGKPFYFELFGLKLFKVAEKSYTHFSELHNSSVHINWAGCIFDPVGFHTNTEKTELRPESLTEAFFAKAAQAVKEIRDEWTRKTDENAKERASDNIQSEKHYRDARVAALKHNAVQNQQRIKVEPEVTLKARVLPPANAVFRRIDEIAASIFHGKWRKIYDALPRTMIEEWVNENHNDTEDWLRLKVREVVIGPEWLDDPDSDIVQECDRMFEKYSVATAVVGRADVAVTPNTSTQADAIADSAERNAAYIKLDELKARYAYATNVGQLLNTMLVADGTNSTNGNLLARGFTTGCLAAVCFLRTLGFKIDIFGYSSLGIKPDKPAVEEKEDPDSRGAGFDPNDFALNDQLTLMSAEDLRQLNRAGGASDETNDGTQKRRKRKSKNGGTRAITRD